MRRYSLHVPLQRNDGTSVTDSEIAGIERDLLDWAGGFTSTDSRGGWRGDDGTVYIEPIRVYTIDAADVAWPRLVSLAEMVATAFDQEAVYITRGEIRPALVEKAVLR